MPDWEYSAFSCGTPATNELIENTTTGASFYVQKTISYGDIVVLTFLALFLAFGILKFLTDFLIPKFIQGIKK